MLLPLLGLRLPHELAASVVVAWPWQLVTFVLAGVCEVSLLRYVFQRILFGGPFLLDRILAGRRTFFLPFPPHDAVEKGLSFSSLALELRLACPRRDLVAFVWVGMAVLAGPGEQLSRSDSSR